MKINNREVEIIDYVLDGVDSYFIAAQFSDTGEDLTDDELDTLNREYPEYLHNLSVSHLGYYKH